MKTNHKFPGILQWYEVIQSETKIFSPVLTAINAVNSACHELQVSIETCRRSCSDNNMKDLSRQLNGMITAQVQGGIPKYQEVIWRFVYYICFCVWQGWDNDIHFKLLNLTLIFLHIPILVCCIQSLPVYHLGHYVSRISVDLILIKMY